MGLWEIALRLLGAVSGNLNQVLKKATRLILILTKAGPVNPKTIKKLESEGDNTSARVTAV